MTFFSPRLNNIRASISRSRGSDYASIEFRARHIRFVLDSAEMQADMRRRWNERGSSADNNEIAFMVAYLTDRFAMRVDFVISDTSPLSARHSLPVTIPMTYFFPIFTGRPNPLSPGLPPRWVETDLLPFSEVFGQRFNQFDPFELNSEWLFSGGDSQAVHFEELDVNEIDYFWGTRIPASGVETVTLTLRVVDLYTPGEEVVHTIVRNYRHDFVRHEIGTRENFRAA